MTNKKNINPLRESVRTLIKNLGVLEKDEASCCGITIAQCHAIVEIGRSKGISLNDLSKLLNLDKSTMSRTVNNLVEQNIIDRKPDKNDRRYINLYLTPRGNEIFEDIEASMDSYFNMILKSIPHEKTNQVIESLNLLIEAIKKNKCC